MTGDEEICSIKGCNLPLGHAGYCDSSRTKDPLAELPIRQLPSVEPRVETGPVAFGDDWPGVFIRGDNALLGFAPALLRAIKYNENTGGDVFDHMALVSLLQVLQSCSLVKT